MNRVMSNLIRFIIIATLPVHAVVINVPGNQPGIQAGINAATDGDTVLVAPGTYLENIDFDGKKIVVGSWFLTTGNRSYISQTVIDGNNSGSVVIFSSEEDSTTILNGFTVTNGLGGCGYSYCHGGGISCIDSSPTLSNLNISGNKSYNGGGIYIRASNPKLMNVKIANNLAERGGGVFIGKRRGPRARPGDSNPKFDKVNRCSIFLNHATQGSDLFLDNDSININVSLDTFSVLIPTNYHASPTDSFIFDINQSKVVQTGSDLYVNPNGSNSNSGLSSNDPLRTISYAHMKILADSLNPHTIFLADGYYTPEERFPIGLVDYVSIVGESRSGVIFGLENSGNEIFSARFTNNTSLNNLTIIGDGNNFRGIFCYHSTLNIKNVTFSGAMIWLSHSNPYIENVRVSGNTEDAGILMYGSSPTLMNVEITNNSGWLAGGLRCEEDSHAKLINCTISNNSSLAHDIGGIHVNYESSLNVVNSILWDNSVYEIGVNHGGAFPDVNIIVTNSLIKGGTAGIHHVYGGGSVFWLGGNIDSDPMFFDPNNADYRLQAGSPGINAGIQDTTIFYNFGRDTLIIPPLNFLGSAPDIGAYEFDPTTDIRQPITGIPQDFKLDQNYPNPFNPTTTIEFDLAKAARVTLKVYTVTGEEVATLATGNLPPGKHKYLWDASGLASGVYLYKIKAAAFQDVKKMVKMK